MTEWREVELGELIEVHDHRRVPISRIIREQRQGEYRYYGAQGVIDHIDDYIFDGDYILVAEDGENLRSRKQPVASIVSGKFWVNNHAHIIKGRSDVADDRFLVHAINIAPLSGLISGAAQPKLTQANLLQLTLPCPDFSTQQRLGAFISAFDELIQINQRRIELLEDLARSLYREWFVRFRFPGHEDVELVDSELGPIPAGWEVKQLGAFVTTQYGFTASASDEAIGPQFLRGMDINKRSFIDWSSVPFCEIDEKRVAKFRLEMGDICVIRMADPGKVGIVESPVHAVFASYLVRLRSSEPRFPPYLLFHYLDSEAYQSWVSGSSTGSTRKSASAAVLTEPRVAIPPVQIAAEFEQRVREIRDQLVCLVEQSATLAATRDLLLPRLVTGRLDISDVDLGNLLWSEAG
jgi:type I restriction enzyme S subunit